MSRRSALFAALLSLLAAACIQQADGQATSSAPAIPPPPTLEFGDANATSSASSAAPAPATSFASQQRTDEDGTLEIGAQEAPLRLTVFLNHASPYSEEFMQDHYARLLRENVAEGSVRLAVIIAPMRKYPNSELEASALLCAGRVGKGREMNEALFALATRDRASLIKEAKSLSLDVTAFQNCLTDPALRTLRDRQLRMIAENGVTLVPTFLIGSEKFVGLPEYPDLRGMISDALHSDL